MMTGFVASGSDARAQSARGEGEVGHHWIFSRGPLARQTEPVGDVTVCVQMAQAPRKPCAARVGVTVALDTRPVPLDFTQRATAEQNRVHAIDRGVRAHAERRRLAARPTMFYGIEPEPVLQFELKREMLLLLATVSGQSLISRAAAGLSPTSSIRAFAVSEENDRERVRATFIQVEDFRGPNPLVTPMAVQEAYAAAGGALFWSGLLGEKLLHHALGDAFVIHPQIWPPGMQVKGSFAVP